MVGAPLTEVAGLIGADPAPHRAAARRIHEAMIGAQWVAKWQRFCAWDMRRDRREPERTIVSFGPLLDPDLPPAIVSALCRELESPSFHPRREGLHYLVPTCDEQAADFDPDRYRRGPIWLNTNWLLWHGLRQHGQHALAEEIVASSVELVRRSGFREYFDPMDGTGRGSARFSWTRRSSPTWCFPVAGRATWRRRANVGGNCQSPSTRPRSTLRCRQAHHGRSASAS